jgi:hypothetical protein
MSDDLPQAWQPSDPNVIAAFEQVPPVMGVPGVHKLWRWLASYPKLFLSIWPAATESLRAVELEDCAHRLRAVAFIVEAVGMPSHKAFRGDLVRAEIDADMRSKIERFNGASQIALSRLIVVAAAMVLPSSRAAAQPVEARYQALTGTPEGAVYVAPLRPEEITGKAKEVVHRVEREHSLPFLDDYYYSIGRIPEYLSAAWNAISPVVGDALYLDRAEELTRVAAEAATELPLAKAFRDSLERFPQDSDSVKTTLRQFSQEVLPQTLLDVTLIRALTSGPEHAVSNSTGLGI